MNANQALIDQNVAMLRAALAEIEEIDVKLDAAGDTVAASRRAVLDEIIEQYPDASEPVAKVVALLSSVDNTQALAIWALLNRSVDKEFGEKFEAHVKGEVEKRKEANTSEKPSDEALTALAAARSEAVKRYRAFHEVVKLFDASALDGIPEPRVRRGVVAGSKQGPRLKGSWDFYVDDKKIGDTVSKAAKVLGTDAQTFKAAITAAGIDLKKPGTDSFSFSVADKTVRAVENKSDDTVGDASDDDDED